MLTHISFNHFLR